MKRLSSRAVIKELKLLTMNPESYHKGLKRIGITLRVLGVLYLVLFAAVTLFVGVFSFLANSYASGGGDEGSFVDLLKAESVVSTINEMQKYVDVDEDLVESGHLDQVIQLLISSDMMFVSKSLGADLVYIVIMSVLILAIVWNVFRLSNAFIARDPFGVRSISAIRRIGFVSILYFFVGIVGSFMMDNGVDGKLFLFGNLRIGYLAGFQMNPVGSLSLGLMFLGLSWVLKHGQYMKSEVDSII